MKTESKIKYFVFFTESSWTICISLVIFYALFYPLHAGDQKNESGKTGGAVKMEVKKEVAADEAGPAAELEAARKENEMLRKELADVLSKCEEIFNSYRRLQLSVASSVANSERKVASDEELKCLESFLPVRQEAKGLIAGILELSQFIETAMDKKELTEADKARMKRKLDDLRNDADRLNAMVSPPEQKEKADKCRILSVNDKLQVVLLDAGSANGVNIGLVWKVAMKDGKSVKLKVISVKPFISAAVAIEGDFNSLATGMPAMTGEK
ncbi:MAG TPA: hypothetical protein DCZ94_01005 [Lentisphaeria bacterium]|nr:MAG: hypothetical protein A2X48_11765 [Lentisphaerae bacterium GWF2_49_21]HBC85509.1 hypothetical protein [Lentisphaeria bacterium]